MKQEIRRIILVLAGLCLVFISLIVYISYFQVFKATAIKTIAIIKGYGLMKNLYFEVLSWIEMAKH